MSRASRSHFGIAALLLVLVTGVASTVAAVPDSIESVVPLERPKIALVLSGGGARGFAQIGVLQALEEAHIPIDLIAGSSMGAVLGGLYAAGVPADSLAQLARRAGFFSPPTAYVNLSVFQKQLIRRQAFRLYFSGWDYRLPRSLFNDFNINWTLVAHTTPANLRAGGDFDRLPIRFRSVALDLYTGEMVVFSKGDLARAIRSSMAIPVTLAPILTGSPEQALIDAGTKTNLPIELAQSMGAEKIIAVNCTQPWHLNRPIDNLTEVALRMVHVLSQRVDSLSIQGWDVWIEPDVGDTRVLDFDQVERLIEAGYEAAWKQMPKIRACVQGTSGASQAPPPTLREMTGDLESLEISAIRLGGRRMSYSWVPRTELGLAKGDRFSLEQLERGLRRLYMTDLYETVWPSVSLVDSGRVELTLELEERVPTYLAVGLLYDNSRNLNVSLEFSRSNLLRIGEACYATVLLGNFHDGLEAGLRSGHVRGLPIALDLELEAVRTRYSQEGRGDFVRRRRGIHLSAGTSGGREAILLAGIRYERELGEGADKIQDWDAHSRSLFVSVLLDGTDQGVLPNRGLRARLSSELFLHSNLHVSHQSYSGNASWSLPVGRFSFTTEAALNGLSAEELPFRFRHRQDLSRSTLGRFEPELYAPTTARLGLTLGYRLAANLSLWLEGTGGLWAEGFEDLPGTQARRALQGGLLQRTPIGPILGGMAFEERRDPFLFIQVGHDPPPGR